MPDTTMQPYKRVTALDGTYIGTWLRAELCQTITPQRAMCLNCHDHAPVLYRFQWESAGKFRSATSGLFCGWQCYTAFHAEPEKPQRDEPCGCSGVLSALGTLGSLWFLLSWIL
jgi:hypothetical protein